MKGTEGMDPHELAAAYGDWVENVSGFLAEGIIVDRRGDGGGDVGLQPGLSKLLREVVADLPEDSARMALVAALIRVATFKVRG